jgi:hypothetical protein
MQKIQLPVMRHHGIMEHGQLLRLLCYNELVFQARASALNILFPWVEVDALQSAA